MKMVCRRCRIEYDESRGPACPSCGVPGLLKTSAILIAAGATEAVYHSIKEVPKPLRTRLIESTTGVNSGTVLIADRQGRRQILRALRRLPGAERSLLQSIFARTDTEERAARRRLWQSLAWLAVAFSALALWLVREL
jgi:hypothetical protein